MGRSLVLILCLFPLHLSRSFAQQRAQSISDNNDQDQEASAAEQYLRVLIRRPRPGIALDRVYQYYLQNDALDELQQRLSQPDQDDASSRQMIWGLIQLHRGQAIDAVAILSQIESKRPDDAVCSYQLGRAYLAVGRTQEAAEAMERATQRQIARTDAMELFTELGRIYCRAKQHDKAMSVWTRLESLFPGDHRVGAQIARVLADEGNFQRAKDRYEQLANSVKTPDQQIAYAIQATEMLRKLGQPAQANETLETLLLKLRPGSWLYSDIRNRIEAGFLSTGDLDGLAEYYATHLKSRPNDLALRTRLATLLISAGRLDEARSMLEATIKQAPNDIETRLALVSVLIHQGKIQQASSQYETLVKLDPGNPDYLIRWGRLLLDHPDQSLSQRRDAAAKTWGRLAAASQEDAVTLAQVADLMRGIERRDEAMKLYQRCIDLEPDSPQYREYLGEYLYTLDRKQEAIETWQSIAQPPRRNRENLVRLAEVLATFDHPELALQTWQQAAEFDLTFAQELRYASKLADAQRYGVAQSRLDVAAELVENPDEHDQLVAARIEIYEASGSLKAEIQKLLKAPQTIDNLCTLTLMQIVADDLVAAEASISSALDLAPRDTRILLIAADLAERQNRFADATRLFSELAVADHRYRTNYLKRVADLQSRLGKVDQALQTCKAIIDSNPASAESYLFYAQTAFAVGKHELAIAILRKGTSVAPRDNTLRLMLARHFANSFRTAEAIELYWEAFSFEPNTAEQIRIIQELAPLYDRKADLDSLVNRIEQVNRRKADPSTTKRMLAAAHESIGDFGTALHLMKQLLLSRPRDVALLSEMVRLSEMTNDLDEIVEFQRRISELTGTPEDRDTLITYQLEAGQIDASQAISARIVNGADPVQLGTVVRSMARRSDIQTAIKLCEQILKHDESLWDIQLAYAQLLMMDRKDVSAGSNRELAMELCRKIRTSTHPADSRPPTLPQRRTAKTNPSPTSSSSTRSSSQAQTTSPAHWNQSVYLLAQSLRIGRYSNRRTTNTSATTLVEPHDFAHAQALAAVLIVLNETAEKPNSDVEKIIDHKLATDFAVPDVETIHDAQVIWEYLALAYLRSVYGLPRQNPLLVSTTFKSAGGDIQRKRLLQIYFRLAELDRQNGSIPLLSFFMQRLIAQTSSRKPSVDLTPLDEIQLERLSRLTENVNTQVGSPLGMLGTTTAMATSAILANEYRLAGQDVDATRFAPPPLDENATYKDVEQSIQALVRLGLIDRARSLLDQLLPAAQKSKPGSPSPPFNQILLALTLNNDQARQFYRDNQNTFIDAAIAHWTRQSVANSGQQVSLGDGLANVTQFASPGINPRRKRAQIPLSPRLCDADLVQRIAAYTIDETYGSQTSNSSDGLVLSDDVIRHLESPLQTVLPIEQKARKVVAAFAHWWRGRPQESYRVLEELSGQFPSDADLRIEQARLAAELGMAEQAIELLDSVEPKGSQMLVRKEMAVLSLAGETGDSERAKLAAERLFGMRLDATMQLFLVDQLNSMGLVEMSAAMLQRTRTNSTNDANTQLKVASAFQSAGKFDEAAEVAYDLFRRHSSGRSNQRNAEAFKRQALSILKSAGRLNTLIEKAEQRAKSSPKALHFKQELADLYLSAGRKDDADRLWDAPGKQQPKTVEQMFAEARQLSNAKLYRDAVNVYLDAFEKAPGRINTSQLNLLLAIAQTGDQRLPDLVFERFANLSPSAFPWQRLRSILSIGSSDQFSESKQKFIKGVLQYEPLKMEAHDIVRDLPENVRLKLPEYQNAMVAAASTEDSFRISSSFWAIRSFGVGGRAYGALDDFVRILRNEDTLRERFNLAAMSIEKDDDRKTTADFLLALLDADKYDQLGQQEDLDRAIETMQRCVMPNQDSSGQPKEVRMSGGLLWQSAQHLENIDRVPAELLIAIYQLARESKANSRAKGLQLSIDNRLIDAYVRAKQFEQARSLLIGRLGNTRLSGSNHLPHGTADLQQLQAFQWFGEKLIEVDSPIDALILYRRALADPIRLDQAERWGRGVTLQAAFENGADVAAEKITPESAARHLKRQIRLWQDDLREYPVDLMEATSHVLARTGEPSSLALAIERAVADPATRGQVESFSSQVHSIADQHADQWALIAAAMLANCYLERELSPNSIEKLFSKLPEIPDHIDVKENKKALAQYGPYFDLYPLAKVAVASKHESTQRFGRRLIEYVGNIARVLGDSSMVIAITNLDDRSSAAIEMMLGAYENQRSVNGSLEHDSIDRCLGIALSAANAAHFADCARALKLALGDGPQISRVTRIGDAFSVKQVGSLSSSAQKKHDARINLLSNQVNHISLALEKAAGISLHFSSSPDSHDGTSVASKQELGLLFDAYLSVLAPKDQSSALYPYSETIAVSQSFDRIPANQDLSVISVTAALAKLAVLTGRESEYREILLARLESTYDRVWVVVALTQLSVASDQLMWLDHALNELTRVLEVKLPKAERAFQKPARVSAITGQMASLSYRKSETIDAAIHAFWPVVLTIKDNDRIQSDPDLGPRVQSSLLNLLTRTIALINSDYLTADRHPILRSILSKQCVAIAKSIGDQKQIERYQRLVP